VSFVDRTYPDIVRDVLTNLTQGVSGEVHRVTYDPLARPLVVPDIVLQRRPVRRVSMISGMVEVPGADDPVAVDFSLNDYELVGDPSDPEDLHTIRFLPGGRRPAPDTDVRVNYYPRTTDPTPLTDVTVGSVVRTLVEAVSKELALVYAQLNLAYESAFIDTATGSSLDRVVALLGYARFRAGRPVGSVRFGRRPGSVGDVSIPAGVPVTDLEDTIRYETVESRTMLAGESTAEVRVRGASDATPVVPERTLQVVQRPIAGIDSVVNERPTSAASADESDAELRARVRVALLASSKGTVGALENGLLQLPDVRAVSIQEFPDDVPGEVRVSVSLAQPSSGAVPDAVLARIEELRPAGIRVIAFTATGVDLAASMALLLADRHLPPAELQALHRQVQQTVADLVAKVGVGQRVRTGPLTAAILADERVVDATIRLSAKGQALGAPGTDFDPGAGVTVRLQPADVSFEADTFDNQPAVAGGAVTVEVSAVVAALPQAGAGLDAVRTEITDRLTTYVTSLTAPAEVTATSLLNALRNDASYQIDPLRLLVTFSSDEQFVQVAQGGQAFTLQPGHTCRVGTVEVVA
jgi:uncharacterized phage protein gp47/JayE